MSTRAGSDKAPSIHIEQRHFNFRMAPITRAIALTLAAGGVIGQAQAQQAFSSAWYANKGVVQNTAQATGYLPNGTAASTLTSTAGQKQRANEQLQRSISNLNLAAQAIAAQQAAQAAARLAAAGDGSSVPDGLTEGGLEIDTNSLTKGWLNAKAPVQTTANGKTTVAIEQTADKAILNWETFNVGRNTTVDFQQQKDWADLNRVNDPQARPSQILGQIKADGTVLIVNRNGIIFNGTSQIDTHNLVAAAATITDNQFSSKGLYFDTDGSQATFTNALGKIEIQAGAQITTDTPKSSTEGGGYVLLLGREVANAGEITTPNGQTVLAAGDSFYIRKGVGTDSNSGSTTRGNEVSADLTNAGSNAGKVLNTGLITATTGDITLTGHEVVQDGVAVATTSTSVRGTIHLSNRSSDTSGTITLAEGATTAIVLDTSGSTALDSQRDAALEKLGTTTGNKVTTNFNNLSSLTDRTDLSRIEIVSGNTVEFQNDSLTLATGGEIAVSATKRTLVNTGAQLDVSGAVGVSVSMESNNIKVNVQGNEQRDSSTNRDSKNLNNSDVWIDSRTLVYVPAGTNGYATDRWYTAGGLLEVSGYLANDGHSVGEWMAQGGTVTVSGGDLVTRAGSRINLSGGTLDVATGYIKQSWLKGADGQLYEVSSAPGDLQYTGLYQGFEQDHARWGVTDHYYNPLIAPQRRLENGYTVGRDAGKLVVATNNAVLEGEIISDVYQGDQQTQAAQAGLDGYYQSQYAVARAGQLIIGSYKPIYDADAKLLRYVLTPLLDSVTLTEVEGSTADGVQLNDAVAADRQGTLVLDSSDLNAQGLGAIRIAAKETIAVDSALEVTSGGEIVLYAAAVDVAANLTAHSGTIRLGNVLAQPYMTVSTDGTTYGIKDTSITVPTAIEGGVTLHEGVALDASGLQTDLRTAEVGSNSALAYVDGGTVSIRSTESVTLESGSLIDVSSGAAVLADGSVSGGTGGNVQLGSGLGNGASSATAVLTLDGTIRGYGVKGGGTLDIESASAISIGGKLVAKEGVLQAGESSLADLILLEDVEITVLKGGVLPGDYSYVVTKALPGEVVGKTGVKPSTDIVVEADWIPPYTNSRYAFYLNGEYVTRGSQGIEVHDGSGGTVILDHIPAGSTVSFLSSNNSIAAFANYVVPADVFPNGLPITARTVQLKNGDVAPFDVTVTLKTGSRLAAGTTLAEDVAVGATTTLSTDLFQTGFAQYNIRAHNGLVVPDGVSLEVTMPVLQANVANLSSSSGSGLEDFLQVWLPDLYQETYKTRTVSQRGGASLSLATGGEGLGDGNLVIGTGASLRVDPGQSIELSSRGSLTVDGLLQARGGEISLLGPTAIGADGILTDGSGEADGSANQRAITLGAHAVLDVSAASYVTEDEQGQPYGLLTDGGSITLGGSMQESGSRAIASDAFVVIKEGALVNASGGQAQLNVNGAGTRTISSDGGSISIASDSGLYLDGTLRAEAGGAGASGGTLVVALEAPNYKSTTVTDAVLAVRELTVVQQHASGASDAGGLTYGHATLGVDQVQDGGFSSLTLYSNGVLSFGGDVELSMGKELRLYSGALAVAKGVDPSIKVSLSAPYVLLAGITDNGASKEGYVRPSYQGGVSTLDSQATLSATADQLDIKGTVTSGLKGTVNSVEVERAGFDQLNLVSSGDLRFVDAESMRSGDVGWDAQLLSAGSILLRAAQVYPATGVSARVLAGRADERTYDPEGRLVIERYDATAADPALPYSVFGKLLLGAATIEQNGVLRAPLGSITLGTDTSGTVGSTDTVTLGTGSLTSVSADGLVMPYGGTADDVTWSYLGKEVSLVGVGSSAGITLSATHVTVKEGALLDLSGGGELQGAGFVSGRGGSTDARYHPLVQVSGDGFTLPSLETNPVYAIVPGYASSYAPADSTGAVDPLVGQQITIKAGDIPGLAAGTYTLLPSSYALLPGAYRVEINGAASGWMSTSATAMRNGSYSTSGTLSTANTGISSSLSSQLIITSADVLRTYSEYNETSYAEFVQAQAELNGTVRAGLPADAKSLTIRMPSSSKSTLTFEGLADFTPAKNGYGGTASILTSGTNIGIGAIEILGDTALPTAAFDGLSLYASDLNAIGAARLTVGGSLGSTYGTQTNGTNLSNYIDFKGQAGSIVLREGAILKAPEVFLVAASTSGGITIEAGAGINTIGMGEVAYDSTDGYIYRPGTNAVVAASNGWLNMLAPEASASGSSIGSGPIAIGVCGATCTGTTELYSEGTLLAATRRDFEMSDSVRYGTRNLVLAVGTVNAGSEADLAAAAASGALTSGLTLNQSVLDRLLQGDTAYGAPALERLVLTAAESVNFFGNVSLDTTDAATGKSTLDNLVLSTPAIYGYGSAGDVATITTDKLTWAGLAGEAPTPVSGGRGTGSGTLKVNADVIEFGYDSAAQPNGVDDFARTILGFANVQLNATDRITANQKGSLSVYQSQLADSTGLHYEGGNLTLTAPLITGAGGSVNRITAGGTLQVLAPASGTANAAATSLAADVQTGAELDLTASSVRVDTTVALPSGKLTVSAEGDIVLGDSAWLDLSGREIVMYDTSSYSWGGDVTLRSNSGNITQAAGSTIDLSAHYNNAGQLTATALAAGAGIVDLQGRLLGSASGHYDAGGTLVPYRAGGVDISAQHLGRSGTLTEQFATLNTQLNAGGFLGERSFQLKQGDLSIGNELKASEINVSLDNGHLSVLGTIDASGEQVGSIRLAAAHGLTLASTAVLDAHSTVLRVDSYGKIIDSPNRAMVELDAGTGTLTLTDGVRIDLRHGTGSTNGDGKNRGTLELYAARLGSSGNASDADAATFGDIAIDARGSVVIQGAKSIAVYGKQVYRDAPYGTDAAASGRPYQVIDQAYLNTKDGEATRFINAALGNASLLNSKLAGLNNATYRDVFHLRPAVEIVSATANGDLVVQGDLDLSGYRYASLNPNTQQTGVYGSGEVGQLTLRAGGDLSIYGSINDGFAPPPKTPDDGGWILTSGVQSFGGDVVVPIAGISLAEGTVYPAGKTLNYTITAKNVTLPAGTVLPSTITLSSDLTLPAGTVLAADVRAADGRVLLAAGTVVGAAGLVVPKKAQLLAGMRLPVAVTLASLTWPKGAALPVAMTQLGTLALPVGALIASGTSVVLPADASSANLRPADSTGHQAQNWAVAKMLPEGSQSWSLRLVAGADTQAADNRLTRLDAGSILLADSHYTVQKAGGGVLLGLSEQGVDAVVAAGGGLPSGINNKSELVGKTQAELIKLYFANSWDDFGLPADFWSPSAGNIQMGLTTQGVDAVVAAGGGLPSGVNSKNDLLGKTAAQLIALYFATSWDDFGLPANFWDYSVGNSATINLPLVLNVKSPVYSVLRTGTGDLDMAAGGNFSMQSPYGVYTAGTQKSLGNTTLDASYNQARGRVNGTTVLGTVAGDVAADYESLVSGTNSLYQAWYPDGGGNLWVNVGGDLTGDSWSSSRELARASSSVGNWLWRQGTGDTAGVNDVPTAWWINFGTYTYTARDNNGTPMYWPAVTGFTGLGTLGGGDATIRVGGDAGVITTRSTDSVSGASIKSARSQGVVLAIGSSGRVLADGSLVLTGGGDLDVRIGGGWNSSVAGRLTDISVGTAQTHELYGGLVNLRGAINLVASQIGTVELFYGVVQDAREVRASDPYTSSLSRATGGLMLTEGDSSATIASRGDLVLGGTGDAGLVQTPNGTPFTSTAGNGQNGQSWFSLWTNKTALDLLAAGGNLALDTRASETIANPLLTNWDYTSNGGWFLLPGNVSAVAAMGSIYYGQSAANRNTSGNATQWNTAGLLLAPLGERRIELLAGDSLYGSGYAISSSGADKSIMATIDRPAFAGYDAAGSLLVSNTSAAGPVVDVGIYPLLTFGINSVGSEAGVSDTASNPSRFYAVNGDIIGLRTGTVVEYPTYGVRANQVDYVAAGPVAVRAGRDIVYTGTRSDETLALLGNLTSDNSPATVSGNLIVHTHKNDVSVVEAGRDILYANFEIAGPGTLEMSAGRNIVQNDKSSLTSIGPVVSGDSRSGASIVVQAGLGAQGANDTGLLNQYLNPTNLAQTGTPLADQAGKVVKTYDGELVAWLGERYGFAGTVEEALAYFNALAPEQQRIFARQVYFAELREGGREYNDAKSPRFGSYLRGRNAIAALFPNQDAAGNKVAYQGSLLMYGGSGIHTNLGGDIQVLTPGGAQTYGVEGAAPPATAGLITRGQGNIQLYSLDSILLGQSRIMTTFGGDILAWSAQGDINAGRGSKTTIVYTPPRRVYDQWGNVAISPDVPSTGAGIATLNPIPEIKPGDVDLIAPLGTIDAGEAGIRVSGNVNIAALHVVNAENIQVQGKSAGLPVVAAVNIGALTNASAAASQATVAAQEVVQRERASARSSLPSIVTVRVIGFGNEPMEVGEPASAPPSLPQGGQQSSTKVPYDPQNFVQIAAHGGVFDSAVMSKLSEAEQRELRQSK
jgi:filamentous hemagglutinin family protein